MPPVVQDSNALLGMLIDAFSKATSGIAPGNDSDLTPPSDMQFFSPKTSDNNFSVSCSPIRAGSQGLAVANKQMPPPQGGMQQLLMVVMGVLGLITMLGKQLSAKATKTNATLAADPLLPVTPKTPATSFKNIPLAVPVSVANPALVSQLNTKEQEAIDNWKIKANLEPESQLTDIQNAKIKSSLNERNVLWNTLTPEQQKTQDAHFVQLQKTSVDQAIQGIQLKISEGIADTQGKLVKLQQLKVTLDAQTTPDPLAFFQAP